MKERDDAVAQATAIANKSQAASSEADAVAHEQTIHELQEKIFTLQKGNLGNSSSEQQLGKQLDEMKDYYEKRIQALESRVTNSNAAGSAGGAPGRGPRGAPGRGGARPPSLRGRGGRAPAMRGGRGGAGQGKSRTTCNAVAVVVDYEEVVVAAVAVAAAVVLGGPGRGGPRGGREADREAGREVDRGEALVQVDFLVRRRRKSSRRSPCAHFSEQDSSCKIGWDCLD